MAVEENPNVSILMTVHNGGVQMYASICSLLAQDFTDFELIVVDNCSDDCTNIVLSLFDDERIRIFSLCENIGRTPALNLALMQAQGKYIAINDADDLSSPSRIAEQVHYLNKNEFVGLVGSWVHVINEDGNLIYNRNPPTGHDALVSQFSRRNPLVHSSIMFRREIALEFGGYDERLEYAQDFGIIWEFSKHAKIDVIPEYLCSWRDSPNSETRNRSRRVLRARDEVEIFKRINALKNMGPLFKFRILFQIVLCRSILTVRIIQNWHKS